MKTRLLKSIRLSLVMSFMFFASALFAYEPPPPPNYDALIYDNYPPDIYVDGEEYELPSFSYDYPTDPSNPFVCPTCPQPKPCKPVCCTSATSHLDIGFATGKWIDTNSNYPFVRFVWFPECRLDGKYLFYQASGFRTSDYKWGGSIGAGLRWQPKRTCHIVGANIFYDAGDGYYNTYHQVGGGIEWLSKTWEARVNGYFPVGNKYFLETENVWDDYNGGYEVITKNIEQVSRGIDVEVGHNLYHKDIMRLYVGIGPAWYERAYSEDTEWAFMARAFVEFRRFARIEVRTFKEAGDRWHVQGVGVLSFPFEVLCQPYTCGLSAPLSDPVYRNMTIKKQRGCCWITNY